MNETTHKKCNKCKEILSIDNFSKCSGGNYLRPECRKCNNKLSKERKELRKRYGNPPKNYRCPICSRHENEISSGGGKKTTRWVIDHDHKTNTFRGWLCHGCNMGLGAFFDDPEILKKAIDYLNKKDQNFILKILSRFAGVFRK